MLSVYSMCMCYTVHACILARHACHHVCVCVCYKKTGNNFLSILARKLEVKVFKAIMLLHCLGVGTKQYDNYFILLGQRFFKCCLRFVNSFT